MSQKELKKQTNKRYYQKKKDIIKKRQFIIEDIENNDSRILCEYVLGFIRQSIKITKLHDNANTKEEFIQLVAHAKLMKKEMVEFELLVGLDLLEYSIDFCKKCPKIWVVVEDELKYKSRNQLFGAERTGKP